MANGENHVGKQLGEFLSDRGAWTEVSNYVKAANRDTIRNYAYKFMDGVDIYTLDLMLKLGFDINECSDKNPVIFDSFYFDADTEEDA